MRADRRQSPQAAPATRAASIADEGVRKVFLHIEKHGAISEVEVTTLLGSPRAFRRWAPDRRRPE